MRPRMSVRAQALVRPATRARAPQPPRPTRTRFCSYGLKRISRGSVDKAPPENRARPVPWRTRTRIPKLPIRITDEILIRDEELEERFVRASGPGGQNVNKVATAVELRFDVARSSLPTRVQQRLATLAGSRMNADGVLLIDSRTHRTQVQNREAARERLVVLLQEAVKQP